MSLRLRPLLALVAFGAAVATATPARADEASDVLAKHKAFVGWQMDDGAIRSLQLDGTIRRRNADGTDTAVEQVQELDISLYYRSVGRQASSGAGGATGFDPQRFWFTAGGFAVPDVSDDRGAIFARRLVFDEGVGILHPVVRSHEQLDGTAVVVLRGAAPAWKPIDVYADAASGAFKQFVYDPDSAHPTAVVIDAYADALPGKKVVSAWHMVGSPLRTAMTTIVANPHLTSADIQPPPSQATWTFAGGKPMPLDVTGAGMYLNATINGVTGRFLVDTGSDSTIVTDRFADRAGLKREGATEFIGITGVTKASAYAHATISFADGSVLRDATVYTGLAAEVRVDGLLGFDFLAGTIADFDLDHARVTLYDPAAVEPNQGPDSATMIVDLRTTKPRFPVSLDGDISSTAFLDTGATASEMAISDSLFKRVPIDTTRTNVYAHTGASGGEVDERCGIIAQIGVGAMTYTNPSVCFAHWVPTGETVLGYGFFRHFNATFDYQDAKIVLERRKGG